MINHQDAKLRRNLFPGVIPSVVEGSYPLADALDSSAARLRASLGMTRLFVVIPAKAGIYSLLRFFAVKKNKWNHQDTKTQRVSSPHVIASVCEAIQKTAGQKTGLPRRPDGLLAMTTYGTSCLGVLVVKIVVGVTGSARFYRDCSEC